ncbi:hypothetical protein [Catelliglobosispora koreensis]|nr:hypothetical protein [Catelliglobosispora koreensis]
MPHATHACHAARSPSPTGSLDLVADAGAASRVPHLAPSLPFIESAPNRF